jgi:hypothetical protein
LTNFPSLCPRFLAARFINKNPHRLKNKIVDIHQATYTLEYVSFFRMKFSTMEGPAFAFFAVDGYSQLVFHTGVENDESDETVLKQIYLLTELEDFTLQNSNGFTLVLNEYEHLIENIKNIIYPSYGSVLYHPKLNRKFSEEAIKYFKEYLQQSLA